jgi:hypothetical protein|tara:strand:+ start:810 stop:1814 length:1005 start_codon:yes stop_codon:yes gene_type:complete
MNLKSLKILSSFATILLLISTFVFFNSVSGFSNNKQEVLVKKFDQLLTDLSIIKLTSKDFQTIIEKKNNQWVLTSHDDFPANAETLRSFFYNLREAKIIGLKTSKKNLHYKLGLSEESRIRIDLNNKENISIKNFDLGVFNYLVGGTYMKNLDEDQSYLVSSNLGTDAEGFHWMSPYLINIGPDQVKKLTIMRPFKKKIILDKVDNEILKLISPSKKIIDEYVLSDVAGNLQSIESEGYILRKDLNSNTAILKTEYEFSNNSSLKVDFFEIDSGIFITLDFTNIPSSLLPLEKRISDSFKGNQFEISSNALFQFAFQINKMNYDNLNIELKDIK